MTAPEEFDDARIEQMLLDPSTAPQPLGRVLGELRDLRESAPPIPSNELSAFIAGAGARSGRGTTAAARVARWGVGSYAAFAASAAAAAVISVGTFGLLQSDEGTGDIPDGVVLAVPESVPADKPADKPAESDQKPATESRSAVVPTTYSSQPATSQPSQPTTPTPTTPVGSKPPASNPPVNKPPVVNPPVTQPPAEQEDLLTNVGNTVGDLLGDTLGLLL